MTRHAIFQDKDGQFALFSLDDGLLIWEAEAADVLAYRAARLLFEGLDYGHEFGLPCSNISQDPLVLQFVEAELAYLESPDCHYTAEEAKEQRRYLLQQLLQDVRTKERTKPSICRLPRAVDLNPENLIGLMTALVNTPPPTSDSPYSDLPLA